MKHQKKLIITAALLILVGLLLFVKWTFTYEENDGFELGNLGPDYMEAMQSEHAICMDTSLVLLPHHDLVAKQMEDMYQVLDIGHQQNDSDGPEKVVIISPNHFNQGGPAIIQYEGQFEIVEHGVSIHEDFIANYWPEAEIESWLIKTNATEQELNELTAQLLTNDPTNTLFIFSVDFSHYLPGDVAYVHDLRSIDVLEAHSYEEISTLEVDSPQSLQIMIAMADELELAFQHTLNTNPAWELDLETFENTTHLFGCSLPGEPRDREFGFFIDFAYPEEWYLGRTEEDRYLYGYDFVGFDTAEINNTTDDKLVIFEIDHGGVEHFDFSYWKEERI